jgi:hypothetical protein
MKSSNGHTEPMDSTNGTEHFDQLNDYMPSAYQEYYALRNWLVG